MPQPITLEPGQEFTFTIRRGVGTADCVSVNYDDFVNDVEVGDMLLVDGKLTLTVKFLYIVPCSIVKLRGRMTYALCIKFMHTVTDKNQSWKRLVS